MLVGELDYDGTFINNEGFEDERGFQILFLQIISICFVCLVSIVISNLLTGLAIKEIDKLISEAWRTDIKEKMDELIEDEEVAYNRILNYLDDKLIKRLNGNLIVCIKPNEIIIDDCKEGKLLKFWHSISGIDQWNQYPVYTTSKNRPIKSPKIYQRSYTDDDLEKINIKVSLKLIHLTMEFLRSKEKEELRNAGKTLPGVFDQVDKNRKSIEDVQRTLQELINSQKKHSDAIISLKEKLDAYF